MSKKIKVSIIKEKITKHSSEIRSNLLVDRLNTCEWIAMGIISLIILVVLFYGDNLGMYLTYFWINDGVLRGADIRLLGNNQLPYGIVQQLFCELWTMPVNILYKIFDFELANIYTVIWFKLSMPFILTLCMKEMIEIARCFSIKEDRIKWMLLLFVSSVLVALPIFHIAQTDILYSYFLLLGLKAYLRDDWKKFLLFMACSISCKVITALVFIALLLLREKRILYIARDAFIGVVVVPLERVWYKVIELINARLFGVSESSAQVGKMTTLLASATDSTSAVAEVVEKTQDQITVDFFSHFYHKALFFEFPAIRKGYSASLMVFILVLIYIWCYIQKKDDADIWKKKAVYVSTVTWMVFFVCASPSPYWIVAMYPFLFLMIFINADRIRINMLLENVFTLLMFLVYVIDTEWVYGGSSNLDYLLLQGLLKPTHSSGDDGPYVARYLYNLHINSLMNVITAICLAAAVALVVVNYYKVNINEEISESEEKKIMHGFAIWQIAILWVWVAINIFVVSRW